MFTRWLKRLAGCTAIELAAAAVLLAASPEYRAGTASAGLARAVAIEDSRGSRAVIVQAAFPIALQVSDVAAAELMRAYGLERGAILLRGTGNGAPQVQDPLTAAAAALGSLKPARLLSTGQTLAILGQSDVCLAQLMTDGAFAAEGTMCGGRTLVRGPIRTAFRMVDLSHGLLQRNETGRMYPIQAIAFGREITVLGLGGEPPAGAFAAPGLIVAPLSNSNAPYPGDNGIQSMVQETLKRVGR